MEKKDETYKIEITYINGTIEILEIKTNEVEWSMLQYQRNRDPFNWKVIK
jgi:hypothetical protein